EDGGRLDFALNPPEAGGDRGGEGEVRVRVRAGDPVLHPEALALAYDAEPARPVVVPPHRQDRRERAREVPLVRGDVGREELGELAGAGQLAAGVLAGTRRRTEARPPFLPQQGA